MLQNSNRLLGPRNDVTRMEKNGRIIWSFDVDFEISFFYFCLIFLSTSQQNVSFFFSSVFKIFKTFLKREKKNHSVLLHHRFVSNDKVFFLERVGINQGFAAVRMKSNFKRKSYLIVILSHFFIIFLFVFESRVTMYLSLSFKF